MSAPASPAPADAGTPLVGAQLFIRYAYPPNSLGYCGPEDSDALFEYGAAGVVDPDLARLARSFSGAWPYLELIAGATGIADPLDRRVVEAYWVGSPLLDRVAVSEVATSMEERFRPRIGSMFPQMLEGVLAGGVPHHSFHVLCVYPWVGLLGDDRKAGYAMNVLDRCRIRWGRVEALQGDQVVVRYRPLTFDGRHLGLGEPTVETVTRSVEGVGYLKGLAVGDWVSMHWDWVCDVLTPAQFSALRHYTLRQLEITNHRVEHSGAAQALS